MNIDIKKVKRIRSELKGSNQSYCCKCDSVKSVNDFCKNKTTYNGLSTYCKPCGRLLCRASGSTPNVKRARKAWALKKKFGISISEYEEMIIKQENRCAICGKTEKENKTKLSVDHNHITGRVRGLLCVSCNNGLGRFFDNTEYLSKAITYLNKSMFPSKVSK
jgi:hypothetical protein